MASLSLCNSAQSQSAASDPAQWVNPFIGTEALTDTDLIGYEPPEDWRVWAGLTYPGAALPNAMVQLSPITKFGTGTGYQYEDTVIKGFAHTNKGHWNLAHIPVLPVTEQVESMDIGSHFSHGDENAKPGYYQVFLEDYNINVELTTSMHSGYHRYQFPEGAQQHIVFNLSKSNEGVRGWEVSRENQTAVSGYQDTGYKVYFYAAFNKPIIRIQSGSHERKIPAVVTFGEHANAHLEMKIGLSFVSVENAKENVEAELANRSFDETKLEANQTWNNLLNKIKVSGGSEKERELFYTSLYRSFLWPALRSDVNGQFRNAKGEVANKDFKYYTLPALWDTYRNKLVLLGMLAPETTADVIQSLVDRGENTGFIPTFFHGDHAAPFIAGSYLRGIDDFDVQKAYKLLIHNATAEGGTRPYIKEYMQNGYIATPQVDDPHVETNAKAAVTKTLEYAYDDYAIALMADTLGDGQIFEKFMSRSKNYKNVFNPQNTFMQGILKNGQWVKNFNPEYPYYEYMYREANAWQSTFFAPHDMEGLMELFGSKSLFETKLDSLFSKPWNPDYIARNVCCFIGQYSQGNQPDHNYPYLYYFVDQQPKTQRLLNKIMDRFYGAGEHGLALSGMDDAGEMSAWYVFNAMGFYPFSPADDYYLVSVPLFNEIKLQMGKKPFRITKENNGFVINNVILNGKAVKNFRLPHKAVKEEGTLRIQSNPN